ncbi:MAG: antibiotic biosynthesis monooxygenase [Desulfobacteraceae bacterium]|jgi:heme-degrading monooxygenase HmoA
MAIKVFIRRTCPKERQKELYKYIREIRSLVPMQPGYISSEYLKTIDESNEITTISSWFSLEDWQAWLNSDRRKEIQAKIDTIEGVESEYRIYRYIKTR